MGNIICMIATLLAQWLILLIKTLRLKRRLRDIMQMSLSLLFPQSPIISFFFHYFLLSHFTVTWQGQMAQQLNQLKKNKKNTSTYFPLLQLCSEEASVPRLLYYHPSLLTFPLESKALLPACVLLLGGQRSGYEEMCWTFCKGPLAASTSKVTYFFSGEKVTEEQLGHFPRMSHARGI